MVYMKWILLIFVGTVAHAQVLKPFVSDGCTMYPDGTRDEPKKWRHCCFEHDLRYWFGGTKTEQKIADLRLKQCVTNAAGDFQGNLMYTGIRLGHLSPIKSKWHWNWGWRQKRKNFSPLSEKEREIATMEVRKLDLPEDFKEDFIARNLLEDYIF
jgi:hypothetical protein